MSLNFGIYFLLLLMIVTTQAERNFQLIGKRVTCYYNTTYIEANNCFIENRENKMYASYFVMWKTTLDKLFLRVELDVKYKSTSRMNLINFYTDVCPILDGIHKSKLFDLFIKNLRKSASTFPKCPIKAHFNYSVSNINVDEEDLPANIPHGPFFIKITYYKNQHVAAYLDFVGEIIRKK